MTAKIKKILGREVLDSRGMRTVQADVILDNGLMGRATAPAGASTGKREAAELRDGDAKRYFGKGVLGAVRNVRSEIARALAGKDPTEQKGIDGTLIELDGTANKAAWALMRLWQFRWLSRGPEPWLPAFRSIVISAATRQVCCPFLK
jgi:enolase